MPLSSYFSGKGKKVMDSMQKQYGGDKGKRVFYATANKKKGKKAKTGHSNPEKMFGSRK